jgi:hypothetical protein
MSPQKKKPVKKKPTRWLPKKYDPYTKEVEKAFRIAYREKGVQIHDTDPTYGGKGWSARWNITKTSKGYKAIGKGEWSGEEFDINVKNPKEAAKVYMRKSTLGYSETKKGVMEKLDALIAEDPDESLSEWIRVERRKPKKKKPEAAKTRRFNNKEFELEKVFTNKKRLDYALSPYQKSKYYTRVVKRKNHYFLYKRHKAEDLPLHKTIAGNTYRFDSAYKSKKEAEERKSKAMFRERQKILKIKNQFVIYEKQIKYD